MENTLLENNAASGKLTLKITPSIEYDVISDVAKETFDMDTTENIVTTTTNMDKTVTTTTTTRRGIRMQHGASATAASVGAKAATSTLITSSKTLKRCLSVPIIHTTMTTRAAAIAPQPTYDVAMLQTPEKDLTKRTEKTLEYTSKMLLCQQEEHSNINTTTKDDKGSCMTANTDGISKKLHMCSNPASRDVSPTPMLNIFAPRARRYSASYSPRGGTLATNAAGLPLCLTSRVSQLRQEECVDVKVREVQHEREVHSAIQISQSWEDLTLAAENWSCKSDEFGNPLHITLPPTTTTTTTANTTTGGTGGTTSKCSSPSPSSTSRTTSNTTLRLPYSPSPTRRVFTTRRSMSPIAIRPSQLAPVKRKFELDDTNASNWNVCSPPPLKRIFTDSNSSSSVCQSPSSVCPSPDSGTFDGRTTPMDDARSETSSIGGWSINESSSCDSGMKSQTNHNTNATATFVNKLVVDDSGGGGGSEYCAATGKNQKSFYINNQGGICGTKKYIVNHATNSIEQSENVVKDNLMIATGGGGVGGAKIK